MQRNSIAIDSGGVRLQGSENSWRRGTRIYLISFNMFSEDIERVSRGGHRLFWVGAYSLDRLLALALRIAVTIYSQLSKARLLSNVLLKTGLHYFAIIKFMYTDYDLIYYTLKLQARP